MNATHHRSGKELLRVRSGFSLIEVIATLALAAVLISLLLPLIDSGLKGSRRALTRLPDTQSLRTQMDAVWQLYRTNYPTDLPGLSAAVASNPSPNYSLLDNGWVEFDAAGVEYVPAAGTENVLKVTLGNARGERLTTYFSPIPPDYVPPTP